MCLKSVKFVPAVKELLVYKLIARRKTDGAFVSPIQKSHVWNTNRMISTTLAPRTYVGRNNKRRIGEGWFHTFSTEKPPISQIRCMMLKCKGGWFYNNRDSVYDLYDLGIIQCIIRGTIYRGYDELDNPGFASTDVELIPESYECLYRSYEEVHANQNL